jgi:hypothetical protein
LLFFVFDLEMFLVSYSFTIVACWSACRAVAIAGDPCAESALQTQDIYRISGNMTLQRLDDGSIMFFVSSASAYILAKAVARTSTILPVRAISHIDCNT